jgi:hypothetical protein
MRAWYECSSLWLRLSLLYLPVHSFLSCAHYVAHPYLFCCARVDWQATGRAQECVLSWLTMDQPPPATVLDGIGGGPMSDDVPLGLVVRRLIRRSYTSLLELTDRCKELADNGNERKRLLVSWSKAQRRQLIRLLVLVKWSVCTLQRSKRRWVIAQH